VIDYKDTMAAATPGGAMGHHGSGQETVSGRHCDREMEMRRRD
ncbi:hypothetical protein A2U01_0026006, partial [Trifolium medium]|nr:hypothetical protein [Trifolium medium]